MSRQIVKDFYLLGRGELYQVFIDLAQHMLKTPPTAVTEHGQVTLVSRSSHIENMQKTWCERA